MNLNYLYFSDESVAHIKHRDGFFGCFRGLTPKLLSNVVSGLTFQKVVSSIKFENLDGSDIKVDDLTTGEKTQRFLQNTSRVTVARVAAVVVSQPLHVIAVRSMAEFVGQDGHYVGVIASIGMVYHEDGVIGFFSGLIPRLAWDVGSLWIGATLAHLVNNYLVEDKDLKKYVNTSMHFLASALCYPLQVVSTCMAVTGTSLVAASPSHMPIYKSWLDCYRHLLSIRNLKRGSSLLWRVYTVPSVTWDPSLA